LTFTKDEILHFEYPNIADMNRGMGPVEAARHGINKDFYMEMFGLSLFANKARPDGVITTEQEIDEDEGKRIAANWRKQHQGIEKAGGIAVLGSGAKYATITLSPKDMEFINSQEFSMEKICSIFSVPPYKLGKVKDVNRSNAHELEHSYQSNTIAPRLRCRDEYMSKVIQWYDDTLVIKSENVIPRDKEFLLKQEDQDMKHAVITINEVRDRRGLEPKPYGKDAFLPINMLQIGLAPPVEEKDGKGYFFMDIKSLKQIGNVQEWKKAYWKYYIRRTAGEERLMISKLGDYFTRQKKRVLANLKKYHKSYKQIDLYMFATSEWDTELLLMMNRLLELSITNGAETLIEDFDLGISFDITSPFVQEYFKSREMLIKNINRTTFKDLKASLEQGLLNGETIKELSGRVEYVFDKATGPRSFLIARTEVNTANNFGHLESMRQANIEKKEWITAGDGVPPTRQSHMDNELDGCIGLNDTFSGTGEEYPSEPNCRCVIIPCIAK